MLRSVMSNAGARARSVSPVSNRPPLATVRSRAPVPVRTETEEGRPLHVVSGFTPSAFCFGAVDGPGRTVGSMPIGVASNASASSEPLPRAGSPSGMDTSEATVFVTRRRTIEISLHHHLSIALSKIDRILAQDCPRISWLRIWPYAGSFRYGRRLSLNAGIQNLVAG